MRLFLTHRVDKSSSLTSQHPAGAVLSSDNSPFPFRYWAGVRKGVGGGKDDTLGHVA